VTEELFWRLLSKISLRDKFIELFQERVFVWVPPPPKEQKLLTAGKPDAD
jgi:hypothetical protein